MTLTQILKKYSHTYGTVIPGHLQNGNNFIFDFTEENKDLQQIDLDDPEGFTNYIFSQVKRLNADIGIGRYAENRTIYKRSRVFSEQETFRSIHLGIDLWAPAGTEVFAPLSGTVHSFRNNDNHGDYGPTIILKHELEGRGFYTLYGHLSKDSLKSLFVNKPVPKGGKIATFGNYEENVHWPPHLHFQIIENIGNRYGDYPGVASLGKAQEELKNCPDPNLILNIKLD